jgi:hypothetical protein
MGPSDRAPLHPAMQAMMIHAATAADTIFFVIVIVLTSFD